MTARLLDFAPAAWQAYQGLSAGELGSQVKRALQRLATDPAAARADPRSRRYHIIEERLPQAPQVWGLPVDTPGGSRWLVVWREMPHAVEIGYIGPAPGHTGEGADRARAARPLRPAQTPRERLVASRASRPDHGPHAGGEPGTPGTTLIIISPRHKHPLARHLLAGAVLSGAMLHDLRLGNSRRPAMAAGRGRHGAHPHQSTAPQMGHSSGSGPPRP